MSYCAFVAALPTNSDNPNKHYHDNCYGFPVSDDNALFERLVLEINQAGLSWTTILKKQTAFQAAYAGFDIDCVAAFDDNDRSRLMQDKGIVRNRLKIDAAIYNARQIIDLRQEYGSFKNWLDSHHPLPLNEWVKLFKRHFKFVGGEIVNEFLMSTGYLKGAHTEDCPVYAQTVACGAKWTKAA